MWFRTKLVDPRLPEIKDYDLWTGAEDARQAVGLAKEIKDAQGNSVSLEAQYHEECRELRRLLAEGLSSRHQRARVDDAARRLRNAQAHVREMRAFARFSYEGHFKQ